MPLMPLCPYAPSPRLSRFLLTKIILFGQVIIVLLRLVLRSARSAVLLGFWAYLCFT